MRPSISFTAAGRPVVTARLMMLWPMFSVTKFSSGATRARPGSPLTILYPSNAQEPKGFTMIPEVARLLAARLPKDSYKLEGRPTR